MAATRLNPRTPGVYIEEIPVFPPSVAQVPTAIPVFIGYTQRALDDRNENISNIPTRISSMLEYERYFGRPLAETGITVNIVNNPTGPPSVNASIDNTLRSPYLMYYSLQWFFINGGGDCWIVSVGDYSTGTVDTAALIDGLEQTDRVDEITLILFPDAVNLTTAGNYYDVYTEAMDKCERLQDRFVIMDVWFDQANPNANHVQTLRDETPVEINRLKYAAAYYPFMSTNLDYIYYNGPVDEGQGDGAVQVTGAFTGSLADLRSTNNALYNRARAAIRDIPLILPPSSAIAGIYARVDNTRGVWKAPANVSVDFVNGPVERITDLQQESLNVDVTSGKSVNVIRTFTGKGTLVWGARTLAGNDNEWRYISVRRFFNMVEESVKKATEGFVFEPNDKNTWERVRAMIENFLILQWRAGALQGKVPEHAFYVKVGLGQTMSALDILEGRMIVEIGMAVVRPAEFIILQFMHKMAES